MDERGFPWLSVFSDWTDHLGPPIRFFADILLTPLEATRIRLVSDPKVSPQI
jgi:hypothetical protein